MAFQSTPSEQAGSGFADQFGQQPAFVVSAPGRVNLIGEHTDYNDGFVFPVAINFHTAVAAAPCSDRMVDVVACDLEAQRVQFSLDDPAVFDTVYPWSNYVRGVITKLIEHGYTLCGARLAISGNIPQGAGLSSSAALEMALIVALTRLSNEAIDAETAARIGQAAENDFVGCRCGIMDQLISAAGRADHAVLLDCRSLTMHPVALPEGLSLLVINSDVQRALVDGEYNDRRRQCEEAARYFGVAALRDLTLEQLQSEEEKLEATAYRRARHVITENQRTLDMAAALTEGRMADVARLMAESHASMRDDFEITVAEIDGLVDIVKSVIGDNGGVRMTGGGFGGCVVALLPDPLLPPVLAAVQSRYPQLTGLEATSFVCQASDGAFQTA